MRWFKRFSILFLVIVIGAAGAVLWMLSALSTPGKRNGNELVTVEPGQPFSNVAKALAIRDIIAHPKLWTLYAIVTQRAERIQAGEYEIAANYSPLEVLEKLVAGEVTHYAFTVVEGIRFKQMLDSLQHQPRLRVDSKGLTESEIMRAVGAEGVAAEGQFLADTYHYPAGTSALGLLRRAHLALKETLDREWQQRAVGLPLSEPYEALILASIIEKETGVPNERAKISGVFTRRLHQRMRLQTDPTVIYGLGNTYQGNLTRKHLRQDTPYNTYTRRGLPPTPIALVGIDALRAALQPEQGSELYFVAKGDGSHFFSDTLEQHNRAVRKYQLNRVEDYRSSPKKPNADEK